MSRSIFIGDVHGCRDELDALLSKVALASDDLLYFVGDLVARGPDSPGVLDLVRRSGGTSVRGNHEEKLIRWKKAEDAGEPQPSLGRSHSEVVRRLGEQDWAMFDAMPLWVDCPKSAVRVIHAGVDPTLPMSRQQKHTLLHIRYLGHKNEPLELGGDVLWGERYEGPPHIVFGHNSRREPQFHPWATGIDTGAVYGGSLTALVLPHGHAMPEPSSRRDVLVSVQSAREYYVGGRKGR